ncbi:MAG: PTS glucose transporter subunit IIA [Clostridiales bacterium]|nr:PTS glucose transporter subunit IIA [Clostridiales bacterium]
MFKKLFKNKAVQMSTPIVGKVIELEEVPDQVFSGKMVGDGFAIDPTEGKVYAPIDGEVIQIFPTKHAIGIKSTEGIEVLIHFGIDTVELKGEGFTSYILAGDQVKVGDLLLEVDLSVLEARGKSAITPIIFTDKKQYKSFDVSYKEVLKNDTVCSITL